MLYAPDLEGSVLAVILLFYLITYFLKNKVILHLMLLVCTSQFHNTQHTSIGNTVVENCFLHIYKITYPLSWDHIVWNFYIIFYWIFQFLTYEKETFFPKFEFLNSEYDY